MAKKSSNPPKGKAANAPKKKAPSAASRNYSLEDILSEYREYTPPGSEKSEGTDAPAGSSSPPPSAMKPRAEELQAFAESSRQQPPREEKPAPAEPTESPASDTPVADAAEVEASPERERPRYRPGGDSRNPLRQLYGWILGQAALLAIKKRLRSEESKKDEEQPELSALDSAKVYASQIPGFFGRSRSAALISLLCIWIALAWGADIPIPGALGSDIRVATLVSLITLLTVMLMGLDVLTVGILSALGGKPGWETLLSVGCLGSLIDCAYVIISKNSSAALPPCAVGCVGVTLALRGSWYRCRGLKSSFLALHRNKGAYTVTEEALAGRKEKYVVRSRRPLSGFIRRSEESDLCEQLGQTFAPVILILLLLLFVVAALLSKESARLAHIFAVLSALCCNASALLTLPMLMCPAMERWAKDGSAVSGWAGIRELGECSHLIITDSDLFPEGSTAFNSVRVTSGRDTGEVISLTGSLVAATGSDLGRLFADLMERSGARMCRVSEFEQSRGGARGLIEGTQVLVGNAGYMYFLGIRIDPTLVGDTVVYAAFDGELVGVFGVEYSPDPKVSAALHSLRKNGKKPYFAVKDFNINAQLVERLFRCKTDNFEFPVDNGLAPLSEEEEGSPVSAIITWGGLDRLVDIFDTSRSLSRCASILKYLSLVSVGLGLLLGFLCCVNGGWGLVSATRLLLYLLFWLLPGLGMSATLRL